ncbi:MAG: VWA domain-containing protein [Sulfurimonadaceae bacterium]|jgi:Ca-activated chloride channel family protein|nr:VWA domain-containing protein [Sulfurimonadaceae bacterium]
MSFLHPEFIYFMVVPLLVLFGLLLTQKKAEESFFSKEVLEKLRVGSKGLSLRVRNGLFFFIGFLMIIALAQPIIEDKEVQVKSKSADVIIALDISDSMLATDIYPTRLVNAKEKMKLFLELGKNERYAILAFARNAFLVAPLTFDRQASTFLLEKLDVSSITEKGTDFLVMLESIEKSFATKSRKFVLLFTDGGDNDDFTKEIAYAKKHNMVVLVLGFGTSKGAPIQNKEGIFIKDKSGSILISKRNDLISALATETGGVYVKSIKTDDDVKAIYKEIENMAPKELQDAKIKKHIPLFYYPLALALFLLLIATSSFYKRETMKIPSFILVLSLVGFCTPSEAFVFDFLDIKDAKTAYNNAEYEKASELYLEHAKETNNPASYYNGANALYKQEKYEQAIEEYQHANFKEKEKQAKNYANLGNAHAMLETEEALEKAKESYEKSLGLEENKEVRENLEMVEKMLEEMKKQEQKDKNQNQEGDDENKDGDNDQNKDDANNQDDKKDSEEEQKDKNQNKDRDKDDKKENEKQDKQDGEEEKQKNENQHAIDEDKQDAQKDMNNSSQLIDGEMSDEEVAKWLEKLNDKSSTYIYKLNKENQKQDTHYDKPW